MISILFWEPWSWVLKLFKRCHLTAVPVSASNRIYHSWGWNFQEWINFVLALYHPYMWMCYSSQTCWAATSCYKKEGLVYPVLASFSNLGVKRCKPFPWTLAFWGQQKQCISLFLSCQTTHSSTLCLQCAYPSWEILLREINFCKWNHPVADGNDMFKTASHTHW